MTLLLPHDTSHGISTNFHQLLIINWNRRKTYDPFDLDCIVEHPFLIRFTPILSEFLLADRARLGELCDLCRGENLFFEQQLTILSSGTKL